MSTLASHLPTPPTRKKRAYTRPCDLCAARRVRCDREQRDDQQCSSCSHQGIVCTNNRIKQKSGPKKIHLKTKEAIKRVLEEGVARPLTSESRKPTTTTSFPAETHSPATCEMNPISLNDIRAYMAIFKARYYSIWPVLSVDDCLEILTEGALKVGNKEFITVTKAEAPTYALCCSICSVISRHTRFWTSEEFVSVSHLGLKKCPPPERYAKEAERTLYHYRLDDLPTVDQVLSNFFLHVYYSSLGYENLQELVYLRQAISCAQMLYLYDTGLMNETDPVATHRIKKIYYLLLITERYVSFKTQLPVVLEPTMPLPNLEDDENPEVLRGFIELAEVFSAPDCIFFNEISLRGKIESTFDLINGGFESIFKKDWLRDVQTKLCHAVVQVCNHSQRLNILLSRTWLQSIAWSMANDKLLLVPSTTDDCFDTRYPLHIATDFLRQASGIPLSAFETNGNGVILKLIELADALHSCITITPESPETAFAFDRLAHVHGIIMRQRTDMTLPPQIHKVTDLLEFRRFGFRHINYDHASSMSSSSRIEELQDDDDEENVDVGGIDKVLVGDSPGLSLAPFLKEFEFHGIGVNDNIRE